MTDERHEKALEAAFNVFDADGYQPDDATISKAIAAYLQAMDAVIVPREASEEMGAAGYSASAIASLPAVSKIYRAMLSKAPQHFTNGE